VPGLQALQPPRASLHSRQQGPPVAGRRPGGSGRAPGLQAKGTPRLLQAPEGTTAGLVRRARRAAPASSGGGAEPDFQVSARIGAAFRRTSGLIGRRRRGIGPHWPTLVCRWAGQESAAARVRTKRRPLPIPTRPVSGSEKLMEMQVLSITRVGVITSSTPRCCGSYQRARPAPAGPEVSRFSSNWRS